MPTTRPRHTVTETDEVRRALEEAARHWPEDSGVRSRLLLHLLDEGYRAILAGRRERTAHRRAAVRRTSGTLSGVYPDDYLTALRDEWAA